MRISYSLLGKQAARLSTKMNDDDGHEPPQLGGNAICGQINKGQLYEDNRKHNQLIVMWIKTILGIGYMLNSLKRKGEN